MVAIATPRRLRVLIGSDQQDWSNQLRSLSAQFDSLPDNGEALVTISSTIVLDATYTVPESINSRDNPARWRRGNPVYVQVRNDADDAWIDPFFARLIIQREPDPPVDRQITLDLGCKLAWADLFEFEGEQTGTVFGSSEACNLPAARLLEASQVSAGDISLNTWPYQIAYPSGKNTQSFAGQAGQLAWSNDARYLYQGSNGQIVDGQLTFTPQAAIATMTIGTNDIAWEPSPSAEQPAEETKAAASGFDITDTNDATPEVIEVTGDFNDYDPSAFGTGVIYRHTVTTVNSDGDSVGPPITSPTSSVTTLIEDLEINIFQDPGINTQLVQHTNETIAKTYESGLSEPIGQAKLISVIETRQQQEKSIVADGVFGNMQTIYRKTTTFTYTDEVVTQVTESIEEAEIVYNPLSALPWQLRESRLTQTDFISIAPGAYKIRERVGIARIASKSTVNENISNPWALTFRTKTIPASDRNRPPQTEFYDGGLKSNLRHYEAIASYTPRGGSTGRNLKRLYEVPFGFSNAQMTIMASIYRDLTVGRHLGDLIELPSTDALVTSGPLPTVQVIDLTGVYTYLADSLTFDWASEAGAFGFPRITESMACSGIWVSGGYA